MPVTARLSKAFYDRVGEQAANELVEWFNAVDATYRADLRELNELNFARFDAKMEQRISASEAKLVQMMSASEAKLVQMISASEAKLVQMISASEAKLVRMIAESEAMLLQKIAELDAKMERRLGEQTRWMFVAWATLMTAIIGFGLGR